MAVTSMFWIAFGGYLGAGFLATFGFEMVKARLTGQVARQRLFGYFALAVAVNSFILPLISDTISGNALSISESDAITESQNFITPLDQVFQFLEDGTTVRIAAALGAGEFSTAGALIKIATLAGLGSGAVGAAVMIPLAYISPIFSFFVPFSMGAKAPVGCTVGPTATMLQSYARPYWILSAVTLPFVFAGKCSLAFFLGSQSFVAWIFAGVASAGLGVVLTYLFLVEMGMGTVGVGLNGLITAPLFMGVTILFLCTKSMRKKYEFTTWKLPKGSGVLLLRCARDGFMLMLKDFLRSVAANLPSMFTAQLSLALQYSLKLINTVSGRLQVFSAFLALMGKLRGARLLGAGENVEFRAFSKKLLIQGCVCGAAGSAAALIGSSALPLGFASSSLKHLEAKPCSHGLYEDVFDSATGPAYYLMAICLFVNALNTVYSSLLYAFRDFTTIMRLAVLNFVVGVPLMVFAFVSIRTLFAIMLASNATTFISFAVYVWRFHFYLMRRLPTYDTVGEAALLPEHSKDGAIDPSTGERPNSLLDIAVDDLTKLLLPKQRRRWSAAPATRPTTFVRASADRPKSAAGWGLPEAMANFAQLGGGGAGGNGVRPARWSAPPAGGAAALEAPPSSTGYVPPSVVEGDEGVDVVGRQHGREDDDISL